MNVHTFYFFPFVCNMVCVMNIIVKLKKNKIHTIVKLCNMVCIMNTIVKLKKNKMLGQFKNHVTIELTELSTETLSDDFVEGHIFLTQG